MLRNKNILIISPEAWGVNKLSKHHYATTLAQRGNNVYFLQPSIRGRQDITIKKVEEVPNLFLIEYTSYVFALSKLPYLISDIFARLDIRRIHKAVNCRFDVVWNFDMFRYQNASLFGVAVTILHPVDFIHSPLELRAARHYDYAFSVTNDIVQKLRAVNSNTYFINHGLSQVFVQARKPWRPHAPVAKIKCGYVGNLGIASIDKQNLFRIIGEHNEIEFNFIGPIRSSNLSLFSSSNDIIERLKSFDNVILHDTMPPERVALAIQDYDIFLICYDTVKYGKMVTNNHKLLEYLSTGKTVIANRTATYDETSQDLFEMVTDNKDLPQRFARTLSLLAELNDETHYNRRVSFADDNTYDRQLDRIEEIIFKNTSHTGNHSLK